MDVYLAADRRTPRGVRGLKSFFVRQTRLQDTRRTPRGVRGLKSRSGGGGRFVPCRTPRGVRGLKYGRPRQYHLWAKSHPSRGAWIEIVIVLVKRRHKQRSHPSRGAWIEIGPGVQTSTAAPRRTPRGVRGLKCTCHATVGGYPGRTPRGVRGLKSDIGLSR